MTVATEEPFVPPPTETGPLHEPRRLFVALGELVLAAVAVWFSFDVWPRGIANVVERYPDDIVLESTRWVGSWMSLAILLGTVAALLVLDAVRQVILAVRARPKRGK
ncbi:hypothetical protein [Actinophytocola oryzae]|uniref:Uncharacterized protein n=1 Tax=Actinophytocola oryzae TaxID=502181 RepID=A0A4R7VD78_9PSEU|nr:hypothetical protein [Actinophytocola oryzae]TDV46985.1 hypothetical protein CLV71_110168 [Actinophytocola oryzae]